jgi:peptidoglycan/xylan/chitin deacetylase (PgdA/CDA1 family)
MLVSDIPIIMYHSVNDHPSHSPLGHLSVSTCEFEAQLRAVVKHNFEFVTMTSLLDIARAGRLGEGRFAVLTFDDGYLDNLLYAKPILDALGAKATVYVCPEFIGSGRPRTLADVPNGWGYLNWAELRLLEESGLVDVQSHTWTHDQVFVGPRVLDVYTADKFSAYYWLIQTLFPETKAEWHGNVTRFASLVPDGYPIFEHNRALTGRQFHPDEGFIANCLTAFEAGGQEEVLRLASVRPAPGRLEAVEEYDDRCYNELVRSKRVIEDQLDKQVETVCFPGGGYSARALHHATRAGYTTFFRSRKELRTNNRRTLEVLSSKSPAHGPFGLCRLNFSQDYPRRHFRRSKA